MTSAPVKFPSPQGGRVGRLIPKPPQVSAPTTHHGGLGISRPTSAARDVRGNSLLVVLLTIAVLAVVAGNLMWSASARYHVTYQSASWQEALVAAEAGIDFGMGELRKRVTLGSGGAFQGPTSSADPGWTARAAGATADYPDRGHAFPADNRAFTVGIHAGEGNAATRTRVYVDVPGSDGKTNFAQTVPSSIDPFVCEQSDKSGVDPEGHYWYRIRSLGVAGVSGPARPSPDVRDNWLRRFSFVTDWRTAKPVDIGGPQVSRLVEIVAKPLTNYRNALMADSQHGTKDFAINLNGQDVLIDSYDSTKGPYDSATNHGELGNLATNGKVINAGLATVKGDAMTNQGSTINDDNVSGQHRDDFYQELAPVTADSMQASWQAETNRGTLTTSLDVTAGTNPQAPTRLHFNNINLTGSKVLNIKATMDPKDSTVPLKSYVKIYVEGDVTVGTGAASDLSAIELADGVSAIVYFTGNVDLRGLGLINDSYTASHLLLQGIQPPADASGDRPLRSINISTSEDFEGILYAPSHDLTLALTAAGPTSGSGTKTGTTPQLTPKQQKDVQDLQKKIAQLNADILNKQLDANNAYLSYQMNPTASNLKNYQDKQNEVTKKQNERDAQQVKLDKLTKDAQSQAEDHARGYNGIYGGFVARTIDVKSKTHLHYDEALREAGPVNHYEIVNWFEDNTSRATVNW